MDRTRPEMMHLNMPASWKLWISFLGGLGWGLSWMGQIAWDVNSIIASSPSFNTDIYNENAFLRPLSWLFEKLNSEEDVTFDLPGYLELWANYALILGAISVWWNPRLREKLWKKSSRMTGKQDYYIQQFIFLAVRTLALYTIPSLSNPEQDQAAHGLMLFFTLIVSPTPIYPSAPSSPNSQH